MSIEISRLSMEVPTMLIILTCVFLEVIAQLCFKRGALSAAQDSPSNGAGNYLLNALWQRWILLGVVAYVLEMVCGVAALTVAPLSVVFPLLSLSYCGVALASRWMFGERLQLRNIAGIALVTLGVVCVAWSAGTP